MKVKPIVSIVIPAYNEYGNVKSLQKNLEKVIPANYQAEYVYVDDGSTDETLVEIKKLCQKNRAIKYISLTRNFGHQNALKCGLNAAVGNAVITMDCDLQHPPKLIPQMLQLWQKGYKIVYTKREETIKNGILKWATSKLFYRLINGVSETKIEVGAADFRLLDRTVVTFIKNNTEASFFLRGLVAWSGYPSRAIAYVPNKRMWGESKYSYAKMGRLALDALTSFSIVPLRIASFIGFVLSFLSGIYGIYAIVQWICNQQVSIGWPSVIVSILFIGGIQLLMLGIIGEYIGKIFMETKKRPLYIIKETNL